MERLARATLGPIDEVVTLSPPVAELDQRLARLADRFVHQPVPGTDGLLVARSVEARVAGSRDCLLEVSAAEARRFGPDPAIGGFAGVRHSPRPGTVDVHRLLAERKRLDAGDRLVVEVGGARRTFRVARVLERVGVAGYCGAVVPAGTVVELATAATAPDVQPLGLVFVSNDGGVVDSVAGSPTVAEELRGVAGSDADDVEVTTPKADLLGNRD